MDEVVSALTAQQHELHALLRGLGEADWRRPSRCPGWDIKDVVLHLAQTDELAVGSVAGEFDAALSRLTRGLPETATVDEGAAAMVERDRGTPAPVVLGRWSEGAARLRAALTVPDMSRRVRWVAGELSLRTLATTRVSETWAHTGDVAWGLGISLPGTDRLRLIARLAWRTLPYAFASAGRSLSGPVAFRLSAPDGGTWEFVADRPALTTITGPAAELCAVAVRRVDPSTTSLRGDGPDGGAVLALVRTYA